MNSFSVNPNYLSSDVERVTQTVVRIEMVWDRLYQQAIAGNVDAAEKYLKCEIMLQRAYEEGYLYD